MAYALWLIALGTLIPTTLAMFVGKALAGDRAVFPLLVNGKLILFGKTWLFALSVAAATYLAMQVLGIDSSTQTTLAGFLAPLFAASVFVRNQLQINK